MRAACDQPGDVVVRRRSRSRASARRLPPRWRTASTIGGIQSTHADRDATRSRAADRSARARRERTDRDAARRRRPASDHAGRADVGLHHEAAGDDDHRQHPRVAARDRPDREDEQRASGGRSPTGFHGDASDVTAERVQRGSRRTSPPTTSPPSPTPAPQQPRASPAAASAFTTTAPAASAEPSDAEQPVRHRERVEEQRSRVMPSVARVRAEQRRVDAADVAHGDLGERDVARRLDRGRERPHQERDERARGPRPRPPAAVPAIAAGPPVVRRSAACDPGSAIRSSLRPGPDAAARRSAAVGVSRRGRARRQGRDRHRREPRHRTRDRRAVRGRGRAPSPRSPARSNPVTATSTDRCARPSPTSSPPAGAGSPLTADLADPDFDAVALVARVEAELGPVDVLVHNAAACFYLPWDAVSPRRYDVMFTRQRRRHVEARDRGAARHARARARLDREPLDDGGGASRRAAVHARSTPSTARRSTARARPRSSASAPGSPPRSTGTASR